MRATLIRDMVCPPDPAFPDGIKPSGTTIDHAEAYRLVQMGVAEAADRECARAAGVTPEQFEAAKVAYERMSRGIHPDDFDAYAAGLMVGYNPDGSWIPGPNYFPEAEEEDEEDDEDYLDGI